MKPIRYYQVHEDHIALYPDPFPSRSAFSTHEYGKTLVQVRQMYSKFDLRPVWKEEE